MKEQDKFWEDKGIHADKNGDYPTMAEYNRQLFRCEILKTLDYAKKPERMDYMLRLCTEFENRFC
jgi:hypothetical protein